MNNSTSSMPMSTNSSSTSTNMTDSSTSMYMTPWLHFGNTDYLIFKPWQASSHGAIAGACIGLFVFCILERCLAAYRRAQELHWRTRTIVVSSRARPGSAGKGNVEISSGTSLPGRVRFIPPFTPSRDIPRGVITALQSTFSYALMLAVMTFNGAYILSIIIGIGVGEVLFGRIGREVEVVDCQ